MTPKSWHLITGEYPPIPGGVGDYTRLLSEALADSGEVVHVWTSGESGTTVESAGVSVHRVAGRFRGADLRRLGSAIDAIEGPKRLFIQYVPHSFGRRAMNVEFCRWVRLRSKSSDTIWTMFHEVLVEFRWRDRPDVWLTAGVTRWMARMLLHASSRVFVSIPAWEKYLQPLHHSAPIVWLPVPSNIPVNDNAPAIREVRERLSNGATTVIGTFGTYSDWIKTQLREVFFRLLEEKTDRVAWILGRSGDGFAAELAAERHDLAGRIVGPGMLDPTEVSLHLQGCDVLIQPYPDGVSSRRTTVMAALAHSRPIVSTVGHLTEALWSVTQAVRLVPPGNVGAMADVVEKLLADPATLDSMSRQALQLYTERFALTRTVETLLLQAKSS